MRVAGTLADERRSPELFPLPKASSRRLLDTGMMQYEASLAGFAERYRRGETSHTVHVWWARRPHSSMRALVFASLCRDSGDASQLMMRELATAGEVEPLLLERVRGLLRSQWAEPPRLLDMFGGGGTIPFEAARLGADAHSIDSNELSVFIQRSLLCTSLAPGATLAGLVRDSGVRVLERLRELTTRLFPKRGEVFGYYWTYSRACKGCGGHFFLSKRPWLSKKGDKRIRVRFVYKRGEAKAAIESWPSDSVEESVWEGKNGRMTCPHCGAEYDGANIQECRDALVVVVKGDKRGGKTFELAGSGEVPPDGVIEELERQTLSELKANLPASRLPRWSGIVNPSLYGIDTHADFLNRRQRAVLVLLVKALRQEYERLVAEESLDTARAVIGLLSGLMDQLIDWNCRLSMWISQNEQVGRAFCGPGIAMLWDYMETDPLMKGPGNLWSKLDRIVAGAEAVVERGSKVEVRRAYAQALPFPSEHFDAIVTDPPYYDNVYYSVLADFFFAWKRVLLGGIEPGLFDAEGTDDSRELVASQYRSGSNGKAHEDYCEQLSMALREGERVLRKSGLFAFVYSHGSLRGWEALVRSYRNTNLRITTVQPLSIERKHRPRAMTSDAVNTCVVFVARRGGGRRCEGDLADIHERVGSFGDELGEGLRSAGWQEADIGLAVYAQGVAMLANVSRLAGGVSDIEALRELGVTVSERFTGFRVADRRSL